MKSIGKEYSIHVKHKFREIQFIEREKDREKKGIQRDREIERERVVWI